MKTVEEAHFSPKSLDDTFSARVYHKFLREFDADKLFFTQQDINTLKAYEFQIDDELRNGSIDFFDSLDAIYLRRSAQAEKYYPEILSKPFTFNGNESYDLNQDTQPYAANETGLQDKWRTYLKYRTLVRYVDLKNEQDKKKGDYDLLATSSEFLTVKHDPKLKNTEDSKKDKDTAKVKFKTDTELEAEAREDTKKGYDRLFKRIHKWKDNDRYTLYVNAIMETEDPHTEYFPPADKSNFDEMMSGSFFGIGAQLREDQETNKIMIMSIVPGSPCWKEGELKAGDEILKVGQADKTPIDIHGYEISDVVKLIHGDKGTVVKLTIKKADGSIKVVPITRDVVKLEETFAKSAVIKSKNGQIGYIYLPEFYADFNHTSGRRCSTDIEAEVKKLKAEGVTGIILDLRGNGGGSLSDVVDMGGLFTGRGPEVQVKNNHNAPNVLRAQTPDTALYSGPLVIMVNEGSASASEIMAAAMQDYKRAVIVGSPTYGKGTVQKMVSLDDVIDPLTRRQLMSDTNMDGALGSVKLTMEKFYRINGGSTQLKGVTPDIMLPDANEYRDDDMGERHNKAALPWDEIAPASFKSSNATGDVKQLARMSQARVEANPSFKLIQENAGLIKKKLDDNNVSLNEAKYRKDQEDINQLSKKMEDIQKKATTMEVVNTAADMLRFNEDSAAGTRNKEWIKNVGKDIYIGETVNIINDMSKSGSKVSNKLGMR